MDDPDFFLWPNEFAPGPGGKQDTECPVQCLVPDNMVNIPMSPQTLSLTLGSPDLAQPAHCMSEIHGEADEQNTSKCPAPALTSRKPG